MGRIMMRTQRSLSWSVPVARFLRARGVLEGGADDLEERQREVETALMVGFRDTGRVDLFEALYGSAQPVVLGWVCGMRRGSARTLDPDDITQEVFLSVYRYASSFRERSGGFRAWCMTIARNQVCKQARAQNRRLMMPLVEGLDPADQGVGPREATEVHEEALELRRAWGTYLLAYAAAYAELRDRDREALRLVEIEGLRYAEAALRLGVGLSNMKMILLRARRRIWKRLGAGRADEGPVRAAG